MSFPNFKTNSKNCNMQAARISLDIHAICMSNRLCLTSVARNSLATDKPVALEFPIEFPMEVLVFVEGGKPENPEKNPRSKDENQQQTQPTYEAGSGNRTRATLVGSECSHHCAIPAPLNNVMVNLRSFVVFYHSWSFKQSFSWDHFPCTLRV